MRSIIYSETGDPSVLRLVDRGVSGPGAGEVRVRVVVSGVNPTDWKFRVGSGDGAAPPFPEVTPNQDGAGVSPATSGRQAPRRSTRICPRTGSSDFREAPASTSAPASAYRR
jgi:NADPH:quinone reductase-like Zn-dependent oxidoreductase